MYFSFGGGEGTSKTIFDVIPMQFRIISEGQGTEWKHFLGMLEFQIFFGKPDIPYIFIGWIQKMLDPSLRRKRK